MAPVGTGCRRALRKGLVLLGGAGCAVLVWGAAAVHGHPVYVGGEDNGVAILSHANTDFKAVAGSTEGGKVRSYLDFETHGDLDAKGAMRHQGKDVATADEVADVERKAANATESLAATVQAQAKATGDGIARLNVSAAAAEAKIGTLETEMDAAEAKIETLETEKDAAESRIGTLETEMDAAEAKIGTLETDMDAAEAKIGTLEDLAAKVAALEALVERSKPPDCLANVIDKDLVAVDGTFTCIQKNLWVGANVNRNGLTLEGFGMYAQTSKVERFSVVEGGKIYFGAMKNWGSPTSSLMVYDPSTNSLTALTPYTGNVADFVPVGHGGHIYITGGYNGQSTSYNSVARYNIATDTWDSAASLGQPRREHGAGVLDGKVYVVSGNNGIYGISASVEVYDSNSNRWSGVASIPEGRNKYGVQGVNGKLYVVGGYGGKKLYVYDPIANRWTESSQLTSAGWSTEAVYPGIGAFGNDLIVSYAYQGNRFVAFDTGTNSWRDLPSDASCGSGGTLLTLGPKILMYKSGSVADICYLDTRLL